MSTEVLLLNNSSRALGSAGYEDALAALQETGEISRFRSVSGRQLLMEHGDQAPDRLIALMRESPAEIVLILSPFYLQTTQQQWEQVLDCLGHRLVVYWEGDPWGRGKPITTAMSNWLSRADLVFSVAGKPQTTSLRAHGARRIFLVPHTYSQVQFATAEQTWEPVPATGPACMMVASNHTRTRIPIPGLTGLPGGFNRYRLARTLARRWDREAELFGSGWPQRWGIGPCAFDQQAELIRTARVTANWDNYAHLASYTSDRLAISMLAGRAHVSTRHPAMDLFPGAHEGVFFEGSVREVVHRVEELLDAGEEELNRLGQAAWSWARFRLSDRCLIRHMLSIARESIAPVRLDPWESLVHQCTD